MKRHVNIVVFLEDAERTLQFFERLTRWHWLGWKYFYRLIPLTEWWYRYVTLLNIFLFMETLLWHDLCSTHHILFPQIAAVKNFWVAARVKKKTGHWKCKSSVKNLNPISATEWNVLLSLSIFYIRNYSW